MLWIYTLLVSLGIWNYLVETFGSWMQMNWIDFKVELSKSMTHISFSLTRTNQFWGFLFCFVVVYFRLFMKLRVSQSYRIVSKLCWQWNKFGVFQQYSSLYAENTCKDSNSISVSTVFEFTVQHQDNIYREIVCVRKKAIVVWLIYEHKIGEY